jgi:hypothetical protein
VITDPNLRPSPDVSVSLAKAGRSRERQRCAQDVSTAADQLQRLTQHVDWQGGAADAFAAEGKARG